MRMRSGMTFSAIKRFGPASARSSLHESRGARKRQGDVEHRAAAQLALRPDPAAVELDDLADDRKAEAGPLDVSRRLRIDARVTLEDRLQGVFWDAQPFVPDVEEELVALRPRTQRDAPARRRVLHRVAEQIGRDLRH